MRFSLFCGITKPKLRKIGRKCKRAYILPCGSDRGAAEVRKRGGKTGPQLAVPAVCGAGRRPAQLPAAAVCDGGAQPAECPHGATAKLRASAAGGCGPRGLKSRKSSPQDHPPGHRRPARLSKEPQTAPAEPPIAKIGRNPLNDIVTVLRPNAITSSARGLRPHGLFLASFWLSLLPVVLRRESWQARQRKKLTSRKNGRKRLPAKFSTG